MWQNKRSYEQEILDLGPSHYTKKEYHHCLKMLARINRLLGGFRASKKAFQKLSPPPKTILDVGCGGGDHCQRLHNWFPEANVLGIDIAAEAIDYAKRFSTDRLTFAVQKEKSLPYETGSFDVVTAMLVCHHMTDEEFISFIKECYRISNRAVILNDLQRHSLAYLSFSALVPFIFRNRLIWNDGRLSIKRAFRKYDWIRLMETAGFKRDQYELKWHWAFRWSVILHK